MATFAFALALHAPSSVRADAVDEAVAAGHAAAARGDEAEALARYEDALRLSSGVSAELSYNVGTLYAHQEEFGRATVHLRRAGEIAEASSDEALVEDVRHNLTEVRRRAEVRAAAAGAEIDRPVTWEGVLGRVLRSPVTGGVALVSGWAFVALWSLGRVWARRGRSLGHGVAATLGALAVAAYVLLGVAYGTAMYLHDRAPEAIVLDAVVEAREGPGSHRAALFRLAGAAKVSVVEKSSGWRRVRLVGGLEGWVPEASLGWLESGSVPPPASSSRDTPTSQPSRPSP